MIIRRQLFQVSRFRFQREGQEYLPVWWKEGLSEPEESLGRRTGSAGPEVFPLLFFSIVQASSSSFLLHHCHKGFLKLLFSCGFLHFLSAACKEKVAFLHYSDSVAKAFRLLHVMGGEYNCGSFLKFPYQVPEFASCY